MKKFFCFMFSLLVMLAFATCNNSKKSSDGRTVLDMLWFNDAGEGASLNRLVDLYEAEHPDIDINVIDLPYDAINDRLRNSVLGGKPPALARTMNLGTFERYLVDLSEYLGPEFADNFNEGGLNFVINGKILGAPMDITVNGLVYNKTLFDQAGITVPQNEDEIWTWEEWKDAMRRVMQNSDAEYGIVIDTSIHRLCTLVYQTGASMLTSDLKQSNYGHPGWIRALNFYKSLVDEGLMPVGIPGGSENPAQLFRTGKVGMHLAGNWLVGQYKNEITDFEWGFTYLPKDARRSSVPGGKYIAAYKGSGVEKEAAEFIEWISRRENNAVFISENYFVSQVRGNEHLDYDFGGEWFEIFASDMAASGLQPGKEWGFQEFNTINNDRQGSYFKEVALGLHTPEWYVETMDGVAKGALEEVAAAAASN